MRFLWWFWKKFQKSFKKFQKVSKSFKKFQKSFKFFRKKFQKNQKWKHLWFKNEIKTGNKKNPKKSPESHHFCTPKSPFSHHLVTFFFRVIFRVNKTKLKQIPYHKKNSHWKNEKHHNFTWKWYVYALKKIEMNCEKVLK